MKENKAVILTTKDKKDGYVLNKIGVWDPIKISSKSIQKINLAYVHFNTRGICVKMKITFFEGRIVFKILEKISNPIQIKILKEKNIIVQKDNLHGIRYLDIKKANILLDLWNEFKINKNLKG